MARKEVRIELLAIVGLLGAASSIAWSQEATQDAPLPRSEALTWGKEPVEIQSTKRAEICLNGIWQFVPMLEKTETQPSAGLAYIRVPGSWKPCWPLPGLVSERGKGPAWKDWRDGSGTWCAWYLRKIRIPAEWSGRAVWVFLDRVSTDAIVYVNGTKCGAIGWPSGEVDISKAVKAGEETTLWIEVMATRDSTPSTYFLDPGRVVATAATLESKGLIGDVFLRSRPANPQVSDVFVRSSTRKKELRLEVELGEGGAAGAVEFTAKLLDATGREEKRFRAKATSEGKGKQVVELAWSWDSPRLWDLGQPNLYRLLLEAKGAGFDDEYLQPFGFREFWIEGRKFLLNGTEIRLRPNAHTYMERRFSGSAELIDAHIDGCIYAGFNMEECWPVNHDEKGSVNYRGLWSTSADRKGFLLMGTSLPIQSGQWSKPEYREQWGKALDKEIRRYRNHPSIVIWTTNPNWLGHGLDQDPRYIGQSREVPGAIEGWKIAAAKGCMAAVKKLDPTRPVLNHAGCSVGDIYNINCYLNFTPLQEREEWLSEWGKSGDMPLMCIEFGTPWKYTFLQGRWGFEGSTEPLVTEYGAIYLGSEAYALETPDYRKAIAKKYRGGNKFGDWSQDTVIDSAPAYQAVQALFTRNTYRSWRTLGITGGMIPWDYGYAWDVFDNERRRRRLPEGQTALRPFSPGMRGLVIAKETNNYVKPFQPGGTDVYPAGVALMEANGPTLAWIGGGKESITSKDHHFAVGQDVTKQVALLNDERGAKDFSYRWIVEMDGKSLAKDQGQGRLEPAKTLLVPFQFRIPDLAGKARAAGTISLQAKIGSREHQDVFSFHAFSKQDSLGQSVMLYDPLGKTKSLLVALGCTVKEWDGKPSSDVIVIGREALSAQERWPFDLEAILSAGGKVLISAQHPDWLHATMGFRVAPQLSRRVFPVSSRHPVCQNLDRSDLCDWSGASTLVAARPEAPLQSPAWRSPVLGWHWGNQGALTSAAIEKPHRSGWRPILECEFDLGYSPLLELDYGQGRLLLSTLDLEDHVPVDPAATVLARGLLRYAATMKPIVRSRRTILVGGETDQKTLEGLGVLFQKASQPEPGPDLLIVGREAKIADQDVQSHLSRGGRVLFLARSTPDPGFGVRLKQVDAFGGSSSIPEWPECEGLGVSDLHLRTEHPAWILESGGEIGAGGLLGLLRQGNGTVVFSQIDPDGLDVDKHAYFRLTRWRQTRALAQILANLGAVFAADPCAVRLSKPEGGLYHPDYRPNFQDGDDPYRYFRW